MIYLGVGGWMLMSLGFYLARSRTPVFNVMAALSIALFAVSALFQYQANPRDEFVVITVGLGLYWFGLLAVGTMLRRSVSLTLLLSYQRGEVSGKKVDQSEFPGSSARIGDLKKYKLGRENDGMLELTWFGKLMGSIVALCYFLFRIR